MCVIEKTDGQGAAGRNDGRIRDQTPSNCISHPTPLCLPSVKGAILIESQIETKLGKL